MLKHISFQCVTFFINQQPLYVTLGKSITLIITIHFPEGGQMIWLIIISISLSIVGFTQLPISVVSEHLPCKLET